MKKLFLLSFLLCFTSSILNSQTWSEQNSGVNVTLYSVSAFDNNHVWVCGASGIVLKTTNGGTNWSNVTSAPIPNTLALYNIFSADTNTALVTGSSASATFVYRTSNGGTNWTQVFTQANGFIDAIWMGNASAGFMYGNPVGGRWSLWGTINGGVTWDSAQFRLSQSGTETGYNNAFYFDLTLQSVWFGTNNTRIYRSTNLIIWNIQPTTGQLNSSAMWFTSPTTGMTGGSGILFTTNAGVSWNPTPSSLPGTAAVLGISGLNSNWWVVRQAHQVYYTNNNGSNWTVQYTAPAGNYSHIIMSRGGDPTLYAVRDSGGISKATNLVGVRTENNEIPSQFTLKQNYPNPFNPNTIINYQLPKSSFVKLVVYDVMGKEVKTLVEQKQNSGTYKVEFDGSNLSSGTYFYSINTGDYHQTLKMELLK